MRPALAAVLLALSLTACGETTPKEDRENYDRCVADGGSYKKSDYDAWECIMPTPNAPTVTVTVTESPEF